MILSIKLSELPARGRHSLPETCLGYELLSSMRAVQRGQPCFVVAEFEASLVPDDGYEFYIGDGEYYGEYENIELFSGINYTAVVEVAINKKV